MQEMQKEVVEMCDLSLGVMERGYKKGIAQGIAQGAKEMALDTARAMLQDGMSVELVAKYSKLTTEEINKLKLISV